MENIYLFDFNNFYNHICVKHDTMEEYGTPLVTLLNTNFIPGDNINTSHVFNAAKVNIEGCDYALVCDLEDNIVSRWYIMSHERTRNGQYVVSLLRDVIADFREDVLNSTAYIRKGTLASNNPLIYNSEGMQFNQIKKSETPLYDKTGRPWIVGYIAANATNLKGANIVFEGDNAPLTNYNELVQFSQNNLQVIDGEPTVKTKVSRIIRSTGTASNWSSEDGYISVTPGNNAVLSEVTTVSGSSSLKGAYKTPNSNSLQNVTNGFTSAFSGVSAALKGIIANSQENVSATNTYMQYNGKVVRDSTTSNYYQVKVEAIGSTSRTDTPRGFESATNSYWEAINNLIMNVPNLTANTVYTNLTTVSYNVTTYKLSLTQIQYGDISITLNNQQRILQDAPYYMFCMAFTSENLQLAIELNTQNGDNFKDVQILPYCPAQDYISDTGEVKLSGLEENKDYVRIVKKNNPTTIDDYLFWCTKSVFTFDIPYVINVGDIKVSNECDKYRICSPNGNGQFEFNAAKNLGVRTINVDCTYRPYDPYIHLNPDFSGLYGDDYNDFRGLILNGDFSIPMINDQWINYTINNKNYQNIFNREIKSMDISNKYAYATDWINAITGALGAGAAGAGGAGMLGAGGAGMGIAGGIAGGLSLAGGIADVYINRALRQEQMNLKKDLFNFNLQNIQAVPQSVAKTGCLTNNNKLVPYIEYYTCTDTEKQALKDMIKYTGMTVGVIGRVSDYVTTGGGFENPKPIQADIIEIDLQEDYHLTMEIVKTLQGGIRIG